MDLNWAQSLLYGLIAGLTDILPVSAQAHQVLLLKVFGISSGAGLLDVLIHLAIVGALYLSCRGQLVRFSRARALSRVPKRKRRRPLDVRSLMDMRLLRTMLLPVIPALLLWQYAATLSAKLMLVSLMLFLNGLAVYIPQFLPGSNRDSRTLSRVEGFLMGLGGALGVVPGFSAVGVSTAIGSVCGVERGFALTMALLMDLFLNVGLAVAGIVALAAEGVGTLSFAIVARYIAASLAAFGGTMLGVRLMRRLAAGLGYSLFGLYCVGLALFTFILNLMA